MVCRWNRLPSLSSKFRFSVLTFFNFIPKIFCFPDHLANRILLLFKFRLYFIFFRLDIFNCFTFRFYHVISIILRRNDVFNFFFELTYFSFLLDKYQLLFRSSCKSSRQVLVDSIGCNGSFWFFIFQLGYFS